jgi:hypothetical protein
MRLAHFGDELFVVVAQLAEHIQRRHAFDRSRHSWTVKAPYSVHR